MCQWFNSPNWFNTVTVYRKGSAEVLETIRYEQVWDGSLKGHRRLRAAIVNQVELLRDKTGLEYIIWSPECYGGVVVPIADKQHITVG